MKKLMLGLLALVLLLAVTTTVANAKPIKGSDPTSITTPNVVDPGDGGGAYPHWTGYCGVGSPYTPYTYGDIGYLSSTARDKCWNDGFMHREIWNGSYWEYISRYD